MTAARKGDLGAHGEQHQHLPLDHLLLGQVLLDVQVRDEHHPLGIPPYLVRVQLQLQLRSQGVQSCLLNGNKFDKVFG